MDFQTAPLHPMMLKWQKLFLDQMWEPSKGRQQVEGHVGLLMHVNHNALLVSISHIIKFGTVNVIANNKMVTIMSGVKSILKVYK